MITDVQLTAGATGSASSEQAGGPVQPREGPPYVVALAPTWQL